MTVTTQQPAIRYLARTTPGDTTLDPDGTC
jgi:hypothetical protein